MGSNHNLKQLNLDRNHDVTDYIKLDDFQISTETLD